ncbi:MAG: hypothetical protein QOF51_3788 [Chloroflexota bacterium]|jgi:uncharacterized membrane protein YeaQ/YmgE (transglycosylase-associated protein family)|nr:hypothetical protein [Chloroflexota bacterium]
MDKEALYDATIGLIIEDGWIAVGAIGALIATWAISVFAGSNEELRDLAGPLLMAMVVAVILANLYSAGRSAARKRVQ